MAANIEALAKLFEKEGHTKWADKFRQDAALFREAGGPERFPQEPQTKTTDVSSHIEVFTPEGLTQELERIAIRYQDMGFYKHRQLQVSKGSLKDLIMGNEWFDPQQPESFIGRFDIPVIVFGHITVKDQAKLAGVDYHLEGLNVRDWKGDPRGYKTPESVYMTWMQDGQKNLKRSVKRVRSTLDPDERGATIHDGIGLYIARPNILKDHYIDLPGTSVGFSHAASLELCYSRPGLGYHLAFFKTDPMFGPATCGRDKY